MWIGEIIGNDRTRPDTWATSVKDGWVVVKMCMFTLSKLDHYRGVNGPTDRLIDGRTDGRADGLSLL